MLHIFARGGRKKGSADGPELVTGRKANHTLGRGDVKGGLLGRDDTLTSHNDAGEVVYSRLHNAETTQGDGTYARMKEGGEICYASAHGIETGTEYSSVRDRSDTDAGSIYAKLRPEEESASRLDGAGRESDEDGPVYDRAQHEKPDEPIYARVVKH